jgi:hypothetical protein
MPDSSHKKQISWIATNAIHQDLINVKQRVYDPSGFECTQPVMEPESSEYGAYTFEVNGFSVRFRVAKITPTKIGQFVTLWKRLGNGPIQPYDFSDPVDFFIINTRKDDRCGQFVFPKSILVQQDVFSINANGGKRAIRVYPPWDTTVSRQAQKTQKWQMEYFIEMPINGEIDIDRTRRLYQKN